MNKLDPFEKLLNAKLQENEVELSYDSWDAIENKLPPAPKSNFYYWLGAAIIIGSITTSIVLFNNNSEKTEENNFENNQSEEISKNEKKTSESDVKPNNSIINLNDKAVDFINLYIRSPCTEVQSGFNGHDHAFFQ